MTRQGIDYAWHYALDFEAFRDAGVTFVARYLSNTPEKNLTPAEARELSNAGFDIVVVWETSAKRALAGMQAGESDAQEASTQASACKMPDGRPIYFAVDFDAQPADLPKIEDYLKGAAKALDVARLGVYGSYAVVRYCFDKQLVAYAWQTAAWSRGQQEQRAQLYQLAGEVILGGTSCDRDIANASDFGQWRVLGTEAPAFPYAQTDYLGIATPDPHCHWGANAADRAQIARWQARMAQRGWSLQATGVFGRQSQRVCRAFQAEKGIDPDGRVRAETWAKAWTAPLR